MIGFPRILLSNQSGFFAHFLQKMTVIVEKFNRRHPRHQIANGQNHATTLRHSILRTRVFGHENGRPTREGFNNHLRPTVNVGWKKEKV